MKHNIRQKVLDPVRGLVIKTVTIDGELGSGITDKNGVEIFEGDRVDVDSEKFGPDTVHIYFKFGTFLVIGEHEHMPMAVELSELQSDELEVVGHVD